MPQIRVFGITRRVFIRNAKVWHPSIPLGMDSAMRAFFVNLIDITKMLQCYRVFAPETC